MRSHFFGTISGAITLSITALLLPTSAMAGDSSPDQDARITENHASSAWTGGDTLHKRVLPAFSGRAAKTAAGAENTCFSNIEDDTRTAAVSQNFEPEFDVYDSAAADDFLMAEDCTVDSVQIPGQYFNGSGPAASETVTIYRDEDGAVGDPIESQTVTGADSGGTFSIPLDPILLEQGQVYWISIQANMDFSSGGEWGWETTSASIGSPAQWKNAADGFGTGCTTWASLQSCIGSGGSDLMFALAGTPAATSENFSGYTGNITGATKSGYSYSSIWVPPFIKYLCVGHPNGVLWSWSNNVMTTSDSGYITTYTVSCLNGSPIVTIKVVEWAWRTQHVLITITISFGDRVKVTWFTEEQGRHPTRITVKDLTTGQTVRAKGTVSAPTRFALGLSTRDADGNPYELSNFGKSSFKSVTINGAPLERVEATAVTLVDGSGNVLVEPSPIQKGDNFTMNYRGGQPG